MKLIRNTSTGATFTATDRLIDLAQKRKDLEVIDMPKVKQVRTRPRPAPEKPVQTPEPEASEPESSEPEQPDPDAEPEAPDGGSSIAEQIGKTKGKNKVHSLILENYGVDLDRRKKLETLKEEALEIIASHQDDDG